MQKCRKVSLVEAFAGLAFIILTINFGIAPLLKYNSLHSSFYDLGLYANNMYRFNSSDGIYIGHVNYFFWIFAKNYQLVKPQTAPYFLIVLQTGGCFVLLLLIYLRYGIYIAFTVGLSYSYWYYNLFDFHFDFIATLLLYFFYRYINTNLIIAVVFALSIMLVKESYALVTLGCGMYIFSSRRELSAKFKDTSAIVSSFVITLIAGCYFVYGDYAQTGGSVFMHTNSMPWHNQILEILLNISKKIDISNTSLNRLLFLILPIATFMFFPLRNPKSLLTVIPLFLACILSSNELHYNFKSHYSLIFLPALCESIRQGEFKNRQLKFMVIFALFLHVLFSPSVFGWIFWSDKYWAYGRSAYEQSDRDKEIKKRLTVLADKPNSMISYQNNLNYYPLFSRLRANVFPIGLENAVNQENAEYVVLDFKRPIFINDKTCKNTLELCKDEYFLNEFNRYLSVLQEKYRIADSFDGFYLYQKK